MNNNIFARLFEVKVDGSQLLMVVDYEIEEDQYYLRCRTAVKGLTVMVGVKCDSLEIALKRMELYTQEKAMEQYLRMAESVAGLTPPKRRR